MKVILALVVLVVALSHAAHADEELANKLKPFEAFSPYKWTQWVALRPSHRPVAAAAVAYAPQPDYSQFQNPNSVDSTEDDDDDDDEDEDEAEYDSLNGGVSAFANWFKRAILPQPPPAPENKKATETKETKKAKKVKAPKVPTTKKPSIVEIPPGFWAPPPSVAPNVTLPPPPGYYAAKKSMFISKLFAALAKSVLNETEPATPAPATPAPAPATPAPAPVEAVTTTSTISPRQAILDQITEVLLSDVTRSLPSSYEDVTREPEEFDDSDEDSDEEDNSAASKKGKPTPPPVNPFLLSQIDFLAKLTEAIAATQQKPTEAPVTTPKPRPTKPTTTAAPKETKKSAKKASKKSAKKLAKTPAYMKWIPTTTTPSPTPAQPEVAAPAAREIDYDALARALLGSSKA